MSAKTASFIVPNYSGSSGETPNDQDCGNDGEHSERRIRRLPKPGRAPRRDGFCPRLPATKALIQRHGEERQIETVEETRRRTGGWLYASSLCPVCRLSILRLYPLL